MFLKISWSYTNECVVKFTPCNVPSELKRVVVLVLPFRNIPCKWKLNLVVPIVKYEILSQV